MNCYLADDIDNDSDLTAEETVTLLCIFVYLLQWNCDRSLCCLHCNRGHECRSQRNKMINISIQLNLFETKNRHRSSDSFLLCHLLCSCRLLPFKLPGSCSLSRFSSMRNMNQCNKCSLFSFYSFLTLPKPHHAKCILNQFYLHYDKLFCKTNPANKLSYFHGAVIRAAHEKKTKVYVCRVLHFCIAR